MRALRAALGAQRRSRRRLRRRDRRPGEPRYDELRAVFNGMIDRRPALIARCADARDVAAAVGFARDARPAACRSTAAATT